MNCAFLCGRPFGRMIRSVAVPALLTVLAIGGCGDCGDPGERGGDTEWRPDVDSGARDTFEPTELDGRSHADDDSGDTGCTGDACPNVCPGTPCGENDEKCCTGSDVCLYDECIEPGDPCIENADCPRNELCEPTLGRCVPVPDVDCEYRPGNQVFEPDVEHAWKEDGQTTKPAFHQVMMTPIVLDVDDSGTPDIVFSTFRGSDHQSESVLRAIDGRTHQTTFALGSPAKMDIAAGASIAGGDIDDDGRNEIVATRGSRSRDQGLIAIDDHATNWKILWKSAAFGINYVGPSIADLNADGTPEVLEGSRVLDGKTGNTLCTNSDTSGRDSSFGADIDDDGSLEVVDFGGVFDFQSSGSNQYSCSTKWKASQGGGYPAVADFGTLKGGTRQFGQKDGIPEVVFVNPGSSDQIKLVEGRTGNLIWKASIPASGHKIYSTSKCSNKNGGGPPTVADFDGDDEPEVGAAGACFYAVFDTDGSLLWKHSSQDFSSRRTGSSVFDFQADGQAEVVYADECFIRVYDGAGDGSGGSKVLFKRSHTSGTTRELPVIADVDGDRHAEIVLVSNDYSGSISSKCDSNWPKWSKLGGAEHGILVIEDEKNRWVSTRPVWNQHAYHVTNVCGGRDSSLCPGRTDAPGRIPIGEVTHWKEPKLNTFRQNVQPEGRFDAPDLVVTDLQTTCTSQGLEISVTVANRGRVGVTAGTKVAIAAGPSGNTSVIAVVKTNNDLRPGATETLTHTWQDPPRGSESGWRVEATADSDASNMGAHNECNEDNNSKSATGSACPCLSDGESCEADAECCSETCGSGGGGDSKCVGT